MLLNKGAHVNAQDGVMEMLSWLLLLKDILRLCNYCLRNQPLGRKLFEPKRTKDLGLVSFLEGIAWTYYAIIFGGALVFDFIDVSITLLIWALPY
jgi:hypothetical protein